MPKKYSANHLRKYLVIVESPAKCKKIEEYLGSGYKCIASFGHLRELHSLKNIDVENQFHPTFTIIENEIKRKQMEKIRHEIKETDEVILATDDDREGEAIAWHLCQIYSLPVEKTKRIVFHEITEAAIQKAILQPRTINMDIVHAQQTRQILDLLVGFHISPVLWKVIAKNKENSLSAGRCQTPALRLVYDNQKEIEGNSGTLVYDVIGYFTSKNIPFKLNKEWEREQDVVEFLEACVNIEHHLQWKPVTKTKKSPPSPFSTSRLQQTASNELHYSPKETMSLCQKLYEGGYITYMRTDSNKYSQDFVEQTKKYIDGKFGTPYISKNIGDLITKTNDLEKEKEKEKEKQDTTAHEAIRPTNISLQELPESVSPKEKKLYKLIWETTLESCMEDAIYFSLSAFIETWKALQFQHTSEQIDFAGWKIVKNKYEKENKEYQYLFTLLSNKKKTDVEYKKITAEQKLKQTKQHYTEARLVQLLEEKGIGRPSTFSMLVEKIQERGYVKKEDIEGREIVCNNYELVEDELTEVTTKKKVGNEKNKLVLQPLGMMVMEFLNKHFGSLFEYEYTKRMEEELDLIAHNKKVGHEICSECLQEIRKSLEKTEGIKKIEIKLDEVHTYVVGKYGPVIKCEQEKKVTFLPIKKDVQIDLERLERGGYTLDELVETKEKEKEKAIGVFEEKEVYIKKGKFGLYLEWGEKTKSLKHMGNRPVENIGWEDVLELLQDTSETGLLREISKDLSIRKSKRGNYIFYKTSKMKKPLFYKLDGYEGDCLKDSVFAVKNWIEETYKIG